MMLPAPWEIRHVELMGDLSGLLPTEANALRVFFRIDGAVLGAADLLASELPLDAAELASLAAERLGAAVAQLLAYGPAGEARGGLPGESRNRFTHHQFALPIEVISAVRRNIAARRARARATSVSIVICTRRRPDHLANCLRACAPELADGREIVVVDNGPDEATRSAVAAFAGVRYVVEAVPGLSRARNAGIRASTGDIIVFTDDDVRPEPGWVDGLLVGFADPATALTTGLVLPAELRHDAQIAFELGLGFGGMGFVPLRFDHAYFAAHRSLGVPVWTIGAGANMAIRREVIARIGYFDEAIGPGAAGGCGDDSEYWYRVLAAGYTGRYEPFSVVRHVHRADRLALRRLAIGYMSGHMAALFIQFSKHRHWGNLRRALLIMPTRYLLTFIQKTLKGWSGHYDFLFWPMLYGYLLGFRHVALAIAEPRKHRHVRQSPKIGETNADPRA